MIEPRAPAIVTAKNRSDDLPVLLRDATKPGIAEKVGVDVLPGIAFGYFHSFYEVPKCRGPIVIADSKLSRDDRRHTIQNSR